MKIELGTCQRLAFATVGAGQRSTMSSTGAKQPRLSLMTQRDLAAEVKAIIAERLGVEEERVVRSATVVDGLGADSLAVVDLMLAFEEAFDIEVSDDDVERIQTVGDVIDYLAEQLGSCAEAGSSDLTWL